MKIWDLYSAQRELPMESSTEVTVLRLRGVHQVQAGEEEGGKSSAVDPWPATPLLLAAIVAR